MMNLVVLLLAAASMVVHCQSSTNQGSTRARIAPTTTSSASPLSPDEQNKRMPVIAIVDGGEGRPNPNTLTDSWESFRSHWPDRPFCVLQLAGANDLFIPKDMALDSNVIFAKARRDGGDSFRQSDWFDLCKLWSNKDVSKVALLVSLDEEHPVSASSAYFGKRLADAGQEPVPVISRSDGNWIQPLGATFFEAEMDVASPSPSSLPSSEATIRATPSPSPTILPSSEAPTRPTSSSSGKDMWIQVASCAILLITVAILIKYQKLTSKLRGTKN